jgi:hypothetical protein
MSDDTHDRPLELTVFLTDECCKSITSGKVLGAGMFDLIIFTFRNFKHFLDLILMGIAPLRITRYRVGMCVIPNIS